MSRRHYIETGCVAVVLALAGALLWRHHAWVGTTAGALAVSGGWIRKFALVRSSNSPLIPWFPGWPMNLVYYQHGTRASRTRPGELRYVVEYIPADNPPEETQMPLDLSNPEAAVDQYIESFVRSKLPSSAALEPELDGAIAANVAVVRKLVVTYALAKLEKGAATLLDSLAAKFPQLAPEINALKAKIPA